MSPLSNNYGLNFILIPQHLRQKHKYIPDQLHEIQIFRFIGLLTSPLHHLKPPYIQLKPPTEERVDKLINQGIIFFFTAELIKFIEKSFTSDKIAAIRSPNALFGKLLKQLSIEKKNILPIAQEYYKIGTPEESFPINDDNGDKTASALWTLKYSDFSEALERLKIKFPNVSEKDINIEGIE